MEVLQEGRGILVCEHRKVSVIILFMMTFFLFFVHIINMRNSNIYPYSAKLIRRKFPRGDMHPAFDPPLGLAPRPSHKSGVTRTRFGDDGFRTIFEGRTVFDNSIYYRPPGYRNTLCSCVISGGTDGWKTNDVFRYHVTVASIVVCSSGGTRSSSSAGRIVPVQP